MNFFKLKTQTFIYQFLANNCVIINNLKVQHINQELLPKRKSVTAISRATILEEQAVSITGDGPLKSKKNDILLEYIAFAVPETQSAVSFRVVLKSS